MSFTAHMRTEEEPSAITIELFYVPQSHSSKAYYLVVQNSQDKKPVLNLKFSNKSPFGLKAYEVVSDVILIAYETYFVIFNIAEMKELMSLHLEDDLRSLRVFKKNVFVMTNTDLLCVDLHGDIKWMMRQAELEDATIEEISETLIIIGNGHDLHHGRQLLKIDANTGMIK